MTKPEHVDWLSELGWYHRSNLLLILKLLLVPWIIPEDFQCKCNLFMYNLYPGYFQKGEKEEERNLNLLRVCRATRYRVRIYFLPFLMTVWWDHWCYLSWWVKKTKLRRVKANALAMWSTGLLLCLDPPSPMALSPTPCCPQKAVREWATQSPVKQDVYEGRW